MAGRRQKKVRATCFGLGVVASAWAQPLHAEDDAVNHENTIVVIGRRREVNRSRQTGQSVTINPTEATRFDSLTHLKRESSVLAPETGRISPSGFVVPKIRGQDVKLTDVYLEDILLQDPYSGLPLVEDLDLRAFGALEIHQGVPPPEVPGLNPIGTLRYRFRNFTESHATAGVQTGQPFGWSSWGLGEYHTGKVEEETSARLYGRHHQTSGRYQYYSDEATPYNTIDDVIKTRANNDQRSRQAVPYIRKRFGSYTLQGLGWLYSASRGLPSMSEIVPSAAREQANGHLVSLSAKREFGSLGVFQKSRAGLSLTDTVDRRQVEDPGRRFLASDEQSDMQVKAQRIGLNAALEGDVASIYSAYESGITTVLNELGERLATDLFRRAETGTIGVTASPIPWLLIEAKAAERSHTDRTGTDARTATLPGKVNLSKKNSKSKAAGGSVGLQFGDFSIYAQHAVARRLPSLVEEFGNGSSILPNADLESESTHHKEVGLSWRGTTADWRLGLAAYEDETWDKIIFFPVMANAVKALNVRATDIRGFDVRGDVRFGKTMLCLSLSRLYPYDKTRADHKILPGVPEKVAVGEIEQDIGAFTLRWFSRYQSEVYRDLPNTVQLPGASIHDVSVDYKTVFNASIIQAGLSIRNVLNLMAVPISAPDTPENKGRTAYSDMAGAPLPGRQWLLSLAVTR